MLQVIRLLLHAEYAYLLRCGLSVVLAIYSFYLFFHIAKSLNHTLKKWNFLESLHPVHSLYKETAQVYVLSLFTLYANKIINSFFIYILSKRMIIHAGLQ